MFTGIFIFIARCARGLKPALPLFLAFLLAACGADLSPQFDPVAALQSTATLRSLPPIHTPDLATPISIATATLQPSPTPTLSPTQAAPSFSTDPQPFSAASGVLQTGLHAYSYQTEQGEALRFLLYLPSSYDPARQWPAILYLHSSLEMGTDLNLLVQRALPARLITQADFPFVVVAPQIDSGYWFQYIDALDDLMDALQSTLSIDHTREYLTGFSLGGYGAWAYAYSHPERFAAIAPVAGSLDLGDEEFKVPASICQMGSVPVWAFHGADDATVDPSEASTLVSALTNCGDEAQLTLYPQVGHIASGDLPYADPLLYEWFLAHAKTPGGG